MKPIPDNAHPMLFRLATDADVKILAELRAEVMRPSLEAVGRFDPDRVRERFLKSFDPKQTWTILLDKKLIGFFVLIDKEDHMHLDHLYVSGIAQGAGVGRKVIDHVKTKAHERNKPVRLCALLESKANQFYLANGFRETHRQDYDIYYEYR